MTPRPLSFHLMRLVWLGLLPLLVLSAGLAAFHVMTGLQETKSLAEQQARGHAAQIDAFLEARILSLGVLAESPLADDPARWQALYAEAQTYQRSFGSHVIFADARRQMLFNTRVPFGTPLPVLPTGSKGRTAAEQALETGRPAVGDIVQGPVVNQPLVAIVSPGLREGSVRHLLLVTTTTAELQQRLDALAGNPELAITVRDSVGGVIARSAPPGFDSARDVDDGWTFVAASRLSPWTVSVEVPRSQVRQPLHASAALLLTGIALATVAGLLGARRLARRIERQAESLADPAQRREAPEVVELATVRSRLDAQRAALGETEERLQLLIDHAPGALAMFDRDMRYLAVSRRWREDYALGERPLLGCSHYEVFPEIQERWKEVHRRGLAGEVVVAEEDRFERQDGSAQWLRWEVHPWHAANGEVGGVMIFTEDITASRTVRIALAKALEEQKAARLAALNQMEDANASRREAEAANAALAASEARYRGVFEAANVGKSVTQLSGEIEVNQSFCDMLGYSPEELRGTTWQALTPEEDIGGAQARMAPLLSGQASAARFEKRYLHKDGSTVWADVSIALQRDDKGQPQHFISTVVNISERKRTEQALRDSEERLRLALAAGRQGLYDLNLETGEALVSPEYATMLGHDPQTFRETHEGWRERLHPDDRARVLKALNGYLAGELASYRVEFRLRTREGGWKWLLSLGEIEAWSADGRPLRMLGTHTDIDALKAAEAALREANATLEARVAERTAELSAANRELETFAYAVSHDLRAPLRALSGFSQALREEYGEQLQGQAGTYLDRINQAATKMGELIEGILALSRSTRGELRHDRVDISALARQRLSELAEETGRRVRWEVQDGLAVDGDERMLSSVLTNLIDNAWKYTGSTESPLIRVHSGEVGGLRGFCVTDNGAGFDMKHAQRLFKPFQRLHRDDQFPGIGIGLATVQRIVQRHGGDITACAAPGEGASFCVGLPAANLSSQA